jgi:uncharacterized protein
MMSDEIKFYCDEHLGKLARWLRIIGWDARFDREIDDERLLRRAGEEGRIVLTRDTRLAEKARGVTVVQLRANYPAHQLRELVEMYGDRLELRVFSRCPACNGEVGAMVKAMVEGLVPPFVFATQERFTRCESCGRIYWQATHRERIEVQLRDILGQYYPANAQENDRD